MLRSFFPLSVILLAECFREEYINPPLAAQLLKIVHNLRDEENP